MAPHDSSNDQSAKQQQQTTAETHQNNIPIIDLAGIYGPERRKIFHQIAEACEAWGFFHLVNHGIDQPLMKQAKDVSTDFFHGPEEEKLKVRVQVPQFGGWSHSKHMTEGNNLIREDSVEFLFNVYYPEQPVHYDWVPQQPASYKSTLLEYTKEVVVLAEKLLGILSETLDLAPEAMQTALFGSSSESLRVTTRTNFYGVKEDGEALPGVCHAHSDPAGLTVLLADDAPGLEVRKDGRWVKVDPILGGLIINVGDMLQVCSNGRYKSVEHRGMPSRKQERLTLATFLGPPMDAVVGPIGLLLDERNPPLYKTFAFGAYSRAFVKAGLKGKGGLERYKL